MDCSIPGMPVVADTLGRASAWETGTCGLFDNLQSTRDEEDRSSGSISKEELPILGMQGMQLILHAVVLTAL